MKTVKQYLCFPLVQSPLNWTPSRKTVVVSAKHFPQSLFIHDIRYIEQRILTGCAKKIKTRSLWHLVQSDCLYNSDYQADTQCTKLLLNVHIFRTVQIVPTIKLILLYAIYLQTYVLPVSFYSLRIQLSFDTLHFVFSHY